MGNTSSFERVDFRIIEANVLSYPCRAPLTIERNQYFQLVVQDRDEHKDKEEVESWMEHWVLSDEEGIGVAFVGERSLVEMAKAPFPLEIVTTLFRSCSNVMKGDRSRWLQSANCSTSSLSFSILDEPFQHVETPGNDTPGTVNKRYTFSIDSSEELHRDLIGAPEQLPNPKFQISIDDNNAETIRAAHGPLCEDIYERSEDQLMIPDGELKLDDRRSSIISFTYLKQPRILTEVEAMSVGGFSRANQDEVIQEYSELSNQAFISDLHLPSDIKEDEPEEMSKKTLSQYELCEPLVLLGTGRYGEVFQVKDKNNDIFAQKVIKKEHLTDVVAKAQFISEVSVLMRCKHSNLVRMYEQAETEEAYLITLELCLGSARTFFKDDIPLSEPHSQFLLGQVIQGVDYLHRQGIMHRDLKLGNILMASPFHLKLGDFGLSKVFNSDEEPLNKKLVRTNTNVGTQFMKAPEQLANVPYSFKIDCWAIGLITWQLMIGGMPFLLRSQKQVKRALRSFRIPQRVSEEGTDFIERLLKPKEEDRASSFKALTHSFVFNPPELLELQKAWPHPYDEERVKILEAQQLTPRQYISQFRGDSIHDSDSDWSSDDLIHLSHV